jgi:hypothetical protein
LVVIVSAVEIVVPARGKALVPTDLSVAIPHGTYARIGERHNLPFVSRFLFGCSPRGCLTKCLSGLVTLQRLGPGWR